MDILKTFPCGCPHSGHKLTCNVSDSSPLPSPSKQIIRPNNWELEQALTVFAEKTKLKQLKEKENQLLIELQKVREEINHYENKTE